MASLSIRKLDEEVIRRLRERAGTHGVSMEEEARRILARAVAAPERIGDLALTMFGPVNGWELRLPEHEPHDPIDFGVA
jgi:plasmid stability protein